MTPPDSADDDASSHRAEAPAYADEARPATWLSDAEQHARRNFIFKVSSAIVVCGRPEA